MFCKKCGAEIKDGKFCKECGTKIEESNQRTSEKQSSSRKIVLIIVGVFVIFLIIGTILGIIGQNANTYGLSANQIQSQATLITGDDLTANYANLVGKPIKIQGKVSSLQNGMCLMFTGNTDGIWVGDPIYVNIIGNVPTNLIDNDIITVYGVVNGKTTYNTAIGGTNTVPEITIYAQNIELNGKSSV